MLCLHRTPFRVRDTLRGLHGCHDTPPARSKVVSSACCISALGTRSGFWCHVASLAWRSCWLICPWSCWADCVRTGSFTSPPHPRTANPAARPGTAPSSRWPGSLPSPRPRSPLSPRPVATAPRGPTPGPGCTPNSPTAPRGLSCLVNCPLSRAASSSFRSSGFPATATPSRCGYGTPAPPSNSLMWTVSGEPFSAGSTWNTPSGSSSKPWAGHGPASAPPNRASAGPGSSWPPTPSSGWPVTSPRISADPGRNRSPNPTDARQPASDEGFATSARRPLYQPAHRNPHAPDQGAHQDPRTSSALANTTSARTPTTRPIGQKQVKNQAKRSAHPTCSTRSLKAMREAFRCPIYWGLPGYLKGLASLLGARRGRSSPQCNSAGRKALRPPGWRCTVLAGRHTVLRAEQLHRPGVLSVISRTSEWKAKSLCRRLR